jgi:hexosaminidase
MPGVTEIDDNIVIDMWETSDAKDKSDKGYKIINSSHYYTYIVPGAPYYGVDDKFVYENWTPEVFSNKTEQNLVKGSPGLLGSKMHIWTDFGPTGYSVEEIARLSIPSMMVFSEKMWGTKGYDSIGEFKKSLNLLMQIPQTHFLDRNFSESKTLYTSNKTIDLSKKKYIKIKSEKKNVEYPWKLELILKRTNISKGNEVILSSRLATIYTDLEHTFISKKNNKKTEEKKRGFGIVRANQTEGENPITSHRPDIIIFDYELPLNRSVKITLVGEKGKISMYADGTKISTENKQMICPLQNIGSDKENVFKGKVKKIEIKELEPSRT